MFIQDVLKVPSSSEAADSIFASKALSPLARASLYNWRWVLKTSPALAAAFADPPALSPSVPKMGNCGAYAFCFATNRITLPLKSVDFAVNFTDSTRSEEHTSELQSLMRISYAVFCLKKKIKNIYEQ